MTSEVVPTEIRGHHDLDVWKASMHLRNLVSRITNQLSFNERRRRSSNAAG
jgi:hypothetical protein